MAGTRALKVGLVGAGAIAEEEHLPYWRELEEEGRVQILGVCDLVKARRDTEAGKCRAARPWASHKRMLLDTDFDIIDVCHVVGAPTSDYIMVEMELRKLNIVLADMSLLFPES